MTKWNARTMRDYGLRIRDHGNYTVVGYLFDFCKKMIGIAKAFPAGSQPQRNLYTQSRRLFLVARMLERVADRKAAKAAKADNRAQ